MAAFVRNDITEKGLDLLAKVQTGQTLKFSKIAIGSGELPEAKSIRSMTALIQPVMDVSITRKKINEDQTVSIGGIFNNTDVTREFYFRELALYAIDPDIGEILYCYGNAGDGAELIPAHNTQTLVEKMVDVVTYIGGATDVQVMMQTGVYASAKDLSELQKTVEQMRLDVNDTKEALASLENTVGTVGVQVYKHTKQGTVHNFTGTGATGRALITDIFNDGDTIQLNGKSVTGTCGADPVNGDTLVKGQWVLFVADAEGKQINFKGGGGLSESKLSQATASPDRVWIGDKFFANGSKDMQTGTLNIPGATATETDVVSGKTFYAGSQNQKTGTLTDRGSRTDAVSISAVQSGGNMLIRIPKGAYRQADSSGYPVISVKENDVLDCVSLAMRDEYTEGVSNYEYRERVGIRIPTGIYNKVGDDGYPVILQDKKDLGWIIQPLSVESSNSIPSNKEIRIYGNEGEVHLTIISVVSDYLDAIDPSYTDNGNDVLYTYSMPYQKCDSPDFGFYLWFFVVRYTSDSEMVMNIGGELGPYKVSYEDVVLVE